MVEETGATLTLTWSATVGQNYQMLYKTNLNQINWDNLGPTNIATKRIDDDARCHRTGPATVLSDRAAAALSPDISLSS